MNSPQFYLLLSRGDALLGTAFPQRDGSLEVHLDACQLIARDDEAKVTDGKLHLAFTVMQVADDGEDE
jgi:hypothetical protein